MFDGNGFVNNMRTKMVQTNGEMFCLRTRLVVGGYLNTALVIFKSAALDNGRRMIELELSRLKFI